MEYVVAVYAVIWVLVVVYVVSLAMRTARLAREAELLARMTSSSSNEATAD